MFAIKKVWDRVCRPENQFYFRRETQLIYVSLDLVLTRIAGSIIKTIEITAGSGDVPLFGDGTQRRTTIFRISFEQHPHIWGYLAFGF